MTEREESITEESITEESIAADEAGSKELVSKRDELKKLIGDLAQKGGEITLIKQKIDKQLHHPVRPSTFNLQAQGDHGWTNFFGEAKRYIQEKHAQEEFKTKLTTLEQERNELEAKIRPLVPLNFYGVQIQVDNKCLTVFDDHMTITG